jgi:hypothetical protein
VAELQASLDGFAEGLDTVDLRDAQEALTDATTGPA